MSRPVHAPQARRSRARRIAVTVWVVVFLLVAIPTLWSVISYAGKPEDQRVPAAGGDVTITEPGEYAVYAESTRGSPGSFGGIATLTGPSGAAVAVTAPGISENYDYGSRVAVRVATFTATEPGTYRIVGDDRGTVAGDELVVGTRTVGALLGVVAGAIATGLLLIVALVGGLVMLLAGRRSPPPAYGAPAWPGRPGPYGPPVPYQGAPYPGGPYQGPPYQGPPYQGSPYQGGPYPGGHHPGGPPPGTAPWGPPPGAGPAGAAPQRPGEDPTVTVRPSEPSPGGPDDRS